LATPAAFAVSARLRVLLSAQAEHQAVALALSEHRFVVRVTQLPHLLGLIVKSDIRYWTLRLQNFVGEQLMAM
jgi:hypothetical protein